MKKFISLVLSLLMLMSLFTVSAFAEDPDANVKLEDLHRAYPEDGEYEIYSAMDGSLCLDIDGQTQGFDASGAEVHLWGPGAQANRFRLTRYGDSDAYKITVVKSNRTLCADSNSLIQWTDYGSNDERWLFEEGALGGENYYCIHAVVGGWIDATGSDGTATPKVGDYVKTCNFTGGPNQIWILKKVNNNSTASTISSGNTWIIAGIAIIAIGAMAIVVKKKKKSQVPATVEGPAETETKE